MGNGALLTSARKRCGLGLVSIVLMVLTTSSLWAWHDPMQPQGGNQPVSASVVTIENKLKLSTILVSPQRRVAVVNGQPLQVGGQIAGYRVDAINENDVVLSGGGKQQRLQLATVNLSKTVRSGITE